MIWSKIPSHATVPLSCRRQARVLYQMLMSDAGGCERGEERVYPGGGGAAGERDAHHPGGGGGPRHQGVPPQGDHSQPGSHKSSSA